MNYTLPKTISINGEDHAIRYDFRAILEIIEMMNDPELSDSERAEALLVMFYEKPETIKDYKTAIEECFAFIDAGKKDKGKHPRLVDWEKDFDYIVAPVNRVLGRECREAESLHWWTFLSAYMEIGPDCMFSQIVSIRDKQARGKKLEKYEREWFNRNKELVQIQQKYTDAETELIKQWTGGE